MDEEDKSFDECQTIEISASFGEFIEKLIIFDFNRLLVHEPCKFFDSMMTFLPNLKVLYCDGLSLGAKKPNFF